MDSFLSSSSAGSPLKFQSSCRSLVVLRSTRCTKDEAAQKRLLSIEHVYSTSSIRTAKLYVHHQVPVPRGDTAQVLLVSHCREHMSSTRTKSTFCAFSLGRAEGPVGLVRMLHAGLQESESNSSASARCSLAAKKWQCRDPPRIRTAQRGKRFHSIHGRLTKGRKKRIPLP